MQIKNWLLVLFFIPFCIFSAEKNTGRLLVSIDSSAGFSPASFAEASSAKLVSIDKRNPFKSIKESPQLGSFLVLTEALEAGLLSNLAERFGYRALLIKGETLDDAVIRAKILLERIPRNSSEIPALTLDESTSLYALMAKIDKIFTSHQLDYWACSGTLLGAVRHGGLIMWDDDLDVCILDTDEEKLLALETVLNQEGLGLHINWKGIYQIYDKNGSLIEEGSATRFPYADVFPMTLKSKEEYQDIYVHKSLRFFWRYPNDCFSYDSIQHKTRVPFGPMMIPIPKDPETNLNALYGTYNCKDIWKKYALEPSYNHKSASSLISGAAYVEIDDYSPAPWK